MEMVSGDCVRPGSSQSVSAPKKGCINLYPGHMLVGSAESSRHDFRKPKTNTSMPTIYEDPGSGLPQECLIEESDKVQVKIEPTVRLDFSNRVTLLLTLSWSILTLYFIQFGGSILVIVKMGQIPHTFGWRSLLLPLGCIYDLPSDTASVPIIPLINIAISAVVASTILIFLFFRKEMYMEWARLFLTIQMVVNMLLVPVSYALWNHTKSKLRDQMLTSITFQPDMRFLQRIWTTTQTFSQCCGVDGYQDWPLEAPGLRSCSVGDSLAKWAEGCYDIELYKLFNYGLFTMCLLIAAVALDLAQGIVLILLNETFRRQELKSPAETEMEAQNEADSDEIEEILSPQLPISTVDENGMNNVNQNSEQLDVRAYGENSQSVRGQDGIGKIVISFEKNGESRRYNYEVMGSADADNIRVQLVKADNPTEQI